MLLFLIAWKINFDWLIDCVKVSKSWERKDSSRKRCGLLPINLLAHCRFKPWNRDQRRTPVSQSSAMTMLTADWMVCQLLPLRNTKCSVFTLSVNRHVPLSQYISPAELNKCSRKCLLLVQTVNVMQRYSTPKISLRCLVTTVHSTVYNHSVDPASVLYDEGSVCCYTV